MQLHAVLAPPTEVLQDVLHAAQLIDLVPTPPAEAPRPGRLDRLLRRPTPAAPPPDPPGLVPTDQAFVRLARLGNVTVDDARNLALALDAVAHTWPAPVVHVIGLAIDTTVPQPVITAQLGGDTDGMFKIFAAFHEVAKQQRFFLDRRSFRPEFTVATVDLSDDPSLRDSIRTEVHDHRGPEWQATSISMLRTSFSPTSAAFEEVALIRVGGDEHVEETNGIA